MAFDIETLDDLITASSCCCPPVLCPVPVRECESATVSFSCYFTIPSEAGDEDDACRRFLTRVNTYLYGVHYTFGGDDQNISESTVTTDEAIYAAGSCEVLRSIDSVFTERNNTPSAGQDWLDSKTSSSYRGGACAGTQVYTDYNDSGNDFTAEWNSCIAIVFDADGSYSRVGDVFTLDSSAPIDENSDGTLIHSVAFSDEITHDFVVAFIDGIDFETMINGTSCYSSLIAVEGCPEMASSATKARITYRVPHEWSDPISGLTVPFPGTYFKLTYDILTTPTGWSDAPEYTGPDRSYLADQTMEWTGPGTGLVDDPSWVIGTVILEPPGEAGTREIVNLRFTCRDEGMFANIPQVTGTAADISEDSPLARTFDRPTGSIHLPL